MPEKPNTGPNRLERFVFIFYYYFICLHVVVRLAVDTCRFRFLFIYLSYNSDVTKKHAFVNNFYLTKKSEEEISTLYENKPYTCII